MRKGHAGVLLVDLTPRGGHAVPMRWSNGPTDGPVVIKSGAMVMALIAAPL